MDISYTIANKTTSFKDKEKDDLHSFLLSNKKGDFILQSLTPNMCKSFGHFLRDNHEKKPIKVIDFIGPLNLETHAIDIKEFQVIKEFKSSVVDTNEPCGFEKFTISPKGGFLYEVKVDQPIVIDLDVKYFDDYSNWGKEYQIYEENGVVFIEFTKKNENNEEQFKVYIGLKTPNLMYEKVEEWIEKNYEYDGIRNLDPKEFVFRALRIDINNVDKKIGVAYALSKEEVIEQLIVFDNFHEIRSIIETGIDEYNYNKSKSSIPLSMQTRLAHEIAKRKIFDFTIKDSNQYSKHLIAGFPWFYQEWVRDEVFSIRAYLEIGEYQFVKDKLIDLCLEIDDEGTIPRLRYDYTTRSLDAPLLLAKRIEDFIFYLEERHLLEKYLTQEDFELFYNSLNKAFMGVMNTRWNTELELVRIEKEEWWRDTISWIEYPLALQLAMTNLISVLAVLAKVLKKTVHCEELLDLEGLYKEKIREVYVRDDMLFDEKNENVVTCDIFLSYYLYPDVFSKDEWSKYFSKALSHIYLHWGGVSSLSKLDSRFVDEYTGANDISYHQGDSWYFINAITAICLNDCDSEKFKKEIKKIIQNLTEQLLFKGTFGHIAEVSSASNSNTRGCPAQTWSMALYLEMIHKVYGLK